MQLFPQKIHSKLLDKCTELDLIFGVSFTLFPVVYIESRSYITSTNIDRNVCNNTFYQQKQKHNYDTSVRLFNKNFSFTSIVCPTLLGSFNLLVSNSFPITVVNFQVFGYFLRFRCLSFLRWDFYFFSKYILLTQ